MELLGNYDPHKKEFKVKMERVNYWVSNGAQVSPTVNNLLVNYKYWDKPKVQSWKPKPQKHGKDTTETQKIQENAEKKQVKTETAPAEAASLNKAGLVPEEWERKPEETLTEPLPETQPVSQ